MASLCQKFTFVSQPCPRINFFLFFFFHSRFYEYGSYSQKKIFQIRYIDSFFFSFSIFSLSRSTRKFFIRNFIRTSFSRNMLLYPRESSPRARIYEPPLLMLFGFILYCFFSRPIGTGGKVILMMMGDKGAGICRKTAIVTKSAEQFVWILFGACVIGQF